MIYAMSELRGNYRLYKRMLELINFSSKDELYIVGNVIGPYGGSVDILYDMSMRDNIFPILGDGEYFALKLLRELCSIIDKADFEKHLPEKLYGEYAVFINNYGQSIINEFRNITLNERLALMEYLEEFELYSELKIGEKNFLLLSGGLPEFSRSKSLDEYSAEASLFEHLDFEKEYFPNTINISGRLPTFLISQSSSGRIYKNEHHIALNCYQGNNSPLGCIRLNDFEEFYVN